MKCKVLILILVFSNIFLLKAQTLKLFDDFESYNDFEISNLGNWTMIDNDNSVTYNIANHTFENEAYVGSYIVFNQNSVIPVLQGWEAYSGDKFLACFSAVAPPNDDWIISDTFVAGKIDTVSFWVKSVSSTFHECFNVYLMNGITENTVVEKLNSTNECDEAPFEWTKVSYVFDNYIGDTLRIGIQCVSDDSYCLQIDDFSVRGRRFHITDNNEKLFAPIVYPNPTRGVINVSERVDKIRIINSIGKIVLFAEKSQQIDLSNFEKGIYLIEIESSDKIYKQKIILK